MATARNLHRLGATVDIDISATGTISDAQGFLAVGDDTQIVWKNTGTPAYCVAFTIGFDNESILIPGHTTSAAISDAEAAVNYIITTPSGTKVSGPYCIQWGEGVLPVGVSATTPVFTIAVPADVGNIQFSSDAEYGITWSATAWSTQPPTVYPPGGNGQNPNPVQTAVAGATTPVYCGFNGAANVPGRGTVLIGSSN